MTGLTRSGTAVRQSLSSRHQVTASDSLGSADKRDCHTRHPGPDRSRPAGQNPLKPRKPSLRTTARPRRLLSGYADTRPTCRQADGARRRGDRSSPVDVRWSASGSGGRQPMSP
ncbi:hypothetical protein GCM10027259_22510 [Micromonospora palomenae]